MTREDVIKGLEICTKNESFAECVSEECPFIGGSIDGNCIEMLMHNALALLKAQEPEVHGRWITYPECLAYEDAYHDEHIVCSACHSVWNIIDNDTERFDYCPVCGAKMDGDV